MNDRDDELQRISELRPEYLALGLLAQGSSHGYELFRRFQTSLDRLWHISESQFYAILKRAEKHGLVTGLAPQKGEGTSRRLLSLSLTGQCRFDEWIMEPTVSSPRLLHLEFTTRLFFARDLCPDNMARMVTDQIDTLSTEIERLKAARREGIRFDEIEALSAAFRLRQVEAALGWIREEIAPLVGELSRV